MRNLFIWTCTLLLNLYAMAQSKSYFIATKSADSLYKAGHYLDAAKTYNATFRAARGKAQLWDRYMAARSWAMSGFGDSALYHLELLVYQERYCPMHVMGGDPAFGTLQHNKRYVNVMDTAATISAAREAKKSQQKNLFEPELAAQLDSIKKADQYYRQKLNENEKRFGRESDEVKILWRRIEYHDSINLIKVTKILDTRGWLGPDILHGGSNTMFLVIQHSDLNTQLKYLPMMREAAANGKLEKSSLAMLEDRVLLQQKKKQIYGTQISRDSITGQRFVSPLMDPDNVDKRREAVGLGPLADYVSHWDLIWNAEQYKKEMSEREKLNSK